MRCAANFDCNIHRRCPVLSPHVHCRRQAERDHFVGPGFFDELFAFEPLAKLGRKALKTALHITPEFAALRMVAGGVGWREVKALAPALVGWPRPEVVKQYKNASLNWCATNAPRSSTRLLQAAISTASSSQALQQPRVRRRRDRGGADQGRP